MTTEVDDVCEVSVQSAVRWLHAAGAVVRYVDGRVRVSVHTPRDDVLTEWRDVGDDPAGALVHAVVALRESLLAEQRRAQLRAV